MRFDREKVILIFFIASFFLLPAFFEKAGSESGSKEDSLKRYAFGKEERDPFSPLISKSGLILIPRQIGINDFALKGIIYSQGEPLAVIGDEVLREGEVIGGYTISKIEEKRVILKKGGEGAILKLEEE